MYRNSRIDPEFSTLEAGRPVPIVPHSVADGLCAPRAGERTFPLFRELVDEVVLLSEEEILAGLPRAHVQSPANLLAAERSLDPEGALTAPMLPAFGSMAAVGEMPPVEGQHRNSIARITHTAILSALSY